MEKIQDMQLEYRTVKWGHGNTQDAKVAQYLNSGESLTPLSAQNNLNGVSRVAARVNTINGVLRAANYPLIKNTMKRTPNGHRYSSYKGFVPADVMAVL